MRESDRERESDCKNSMNTANNHKRGSDGCDDSIYLLNNSSLCWNDLSKIEKLSHEQLSCQTLCGQGTKGLPFFIMM